MLDRAAGDTIRIEDFIRSWYQLVGILKDQLDNNADELNLLEYLDKVKKHSDLLDDGITIIDEKGVLDSKEVLLLKASAVLPFSLGAFKSLEDVINHLGVKIVIDPDTKVRYHSSLNRNKEELEHWKAVLESLKEEENNPEYKDAEMMVDYYTRQSKIWRETTVLGKYFPVDDIGEHVIKLYPNVMRAECDNLMNELLVTTFVHEVMHAYFDRPRHSHFDFPHFYSDEEPMAEFGTLLYLYETKQKRFYDWAYSHISNKKTYYRYGAAMMNMYKKESTPSITREELEVYRTPKY